MVDRRRASDGGRYASLRAAQASCLAPIQAGRLRYAAVVGFAAVLVLSVYRSTTPARGHAPTINACHSSVTWTVALPGAAAEAAQKAHTALNGTFWVGVLSLASGVAIVQLAGLLRTVRIGSRCGH